MSSSSVLSPTRRINRQQTHAFQHPLITYKSIAVLSNKAKKIHRCIFNVVIWWASVAVVLDMCPALSCRERDVWWTCINECQGRLAASKQWLIGRGNLNISQRERISCNQSDMLYYVLSVLFMQYIPWNMQTVLLWAVLICLYILINMLWW